MQATANPQNESLSQRYVQPITLVIVFAILTRLIGVRSMIKGLRCVGVLPRKELLACGPLQAFQPYRALCALQQNVSR